MYEIKFVTYTHEGRKDRTKRRKEGRKMKDTFLLNAFRRQNNKKYAYYKKYEGASHLPTPTPYSFCKMINT